MFEGIQGAENKHALIVGFAFFLTFLGITGAGCWMAVGEDVASWAGPRLRGERTWAGDAQYVPPNPVDAQALAAVDLAALHNELLPDWSVALGWRSQDEARYQAARQALFAAVVTEPNLDALLAELVQGAETDPWGQADRLSWLAWAWGHYLDQNGHPWRFDIQVLRREERDLFYTKSYRTEGEGLVQLGLVPVRVRWIRRVDNTNVVERYDGVVKWPEDGGFLLVDRLRESATELVWPALAPDAPTVRHAGAFRAAIRAELAAGLPNEALAVLEQTAPVRAQLLADVAAIRERQACGSRFVIPLIPNLGFEARSLAALDRAARQTDHHKCPQVRIDEAERLRFAAEVLAETEGLPEAVAALTAWVARGTAIHEARHVADARRYGDLEQPIPCRACDGALGASSRAELSAYLASFADPRQGATSMLQACQTGDRGSHGAAMTWLASEAPSFSCELGFGEGLPAEAAALEQRLFGRSERAALLGMPDRL